jgi:C4-dicarboxylate transporter DctM subunit
MRVEELASIVGVSVEEFTKELWPFLIALVAVLFLVTYFPPAVLWLPNLVMGK